MLPMLRQVPYWYSRYYDTIMAVFEEVMRTTLVPFIYVLPSPPALSYNLDCVRLSEQFGPVYIIHMLEKACQFDESNLSQQYLKFESNFNIPASRTTGVITDLATVKTDVTENSVVIHEEKDGQINVDDEHRFLLAGLKVAKLADWTECQAAYASAVKSFLVKLKPEFSTIEVTTCSYMKAINICRVWRC